MIFSGMLRGKKEKGESQQKKCAYQTNGRRKLKKKSASLKERVNQNLYTMNRDVDEKSKKGRICSFFSAFF
jgi:hypothetical protein